LQEEIFQVIVAVQVAVEQAALEQVMLTIISAVLVDLVQTHS
jgi:hypothetical protein